MTDPASAELIKYASNAFLATKISYINAIANLCEAVGADVREVVLGMGYDKRIGFEFLRPGPGWGGSCFPKDTNALVRIAEDAGLRFRSARRGDRGQRRAVRADGGQDRPGRPDGILDGATVAVWGLTFKAMTDDLRDSPVARGGRPAPPARGARCGPIDPMVDDRRCRGDRPLARAHIVRRPVRGLRPGADVVALLTEWDEFRWLDFDKVRARSLRPGRSSTAATPRPGRLRKRGFSYHGVGRE